MIFLDKTQNDELAKKGYVVVPFFSDEELKHAIALHAKFKSSSPYFHSTTFSKDVDWKKELNEEGAKIFSKRISSLFAAHKNLGVSFLTKPRGEGGHMPVHQDWTIVDETRFGSFTVWVPIQDVNESNGAITVIDGSHKLHTSLRAPSLPVVISVIEPQIKQRMKTLCMKAGEAFIFNHALVHASHLNTSEIDRVAITYGLVPKDAQLLFYHLNEDGSTDKYEVADDFFLQYDNHGERPNFVVPKEKMNVNFTPLTANTFDQFLNDYKVKNMKTIFKDAALQAQFEKEGYALVDMLTADEVSELKAYYETLNNNHISSYGFHVSLDNSNSEFVANVMSKIRTAVTAKADSVFENYKIFTTSFVVKESNPVSLVPPHQDWNFSEEDEGFVSATVWATLVDTDMNNGAMGLIVGSHKFFDHVRASPAPAFQTPIDPHVFSIFSYLKMIPMKAGQALVFNNKTVHASPPNISNSVRLAVGFGVTQADAPMRHYYLKPGSNAKTLLKYEIDDYFFTHYNNGKLMELYNQNKTLDDLNFLGEVENRVQSISGDDLINLIKAEGNTFNAELCEHLAKLFGFNMDGIRKKEWVSAVEETIETTQPVEEIAMVEEVVSFTEPVNSKSEWESRTFFQKYTPLNIIREIKERVLA